MAGIKISALPAVSAAQLTDIFPVVQGGTTSQETVAQLVSLLNSGSILTSYVPIAGGTMTGPLILSSDPITLPLQAATKDYVDQFASGLTVVLAAQAATTGNLNATAAGAGVGATLTNAGAMAAFAVDGYSASLNDRILVKNQTLPQHNGIYKVTTVGSGAANWVLTRATDYDTNTEIVPGTLVAVNNGTVNATTSWLETATVVTVDTDPVLFSQFTFSPTSFLLRANNLSDLNSAPTALVNLGLGTPTGTGNVVLNNSPTLISPILGAASATSLTFSSTSGIIGTTTNDSAAVGSVGEYVSSTVLTTSGVGFTSNVVRNITSILLSAGDWDVYGNVCFEGAGAPTLCIAWTSTSSATEPNDALTTFINTSLAFLTSLVTPVIRVSIAVPTTVYLSARCVYTGSTISGSGSISARRVR